VASAGGGIKRPSLHGHGGLRQRCADGGRIRLRTQIRKNS